MLLLSLSLLASSLYMQTVKAQTLLDSYDGGNIFDAPIQVPNYLGAGAALLYLMMLQFHQLALNCIVLETLSAL